MNRFLNYAVALATVLALGLTSCHSEDDDDFGPISPEDKELINSNVPSEGWSGDSQNGVYRYAPSEYEPDEPNSYYAFNMKDGVCQSAALNLVMENASQARQIAQMLSNGTWADFDDDDDEDDEYDYYQTCAFDIAKSFRKIKSRANNSRSGLTLAIPVQQEGKVIYIMLPNFKGLSTEDIHKVMDLWNGNTTIIPDHIIFGEYQNGIYTCDNMHGLNINYKVVTEFNSADFCTKYTTSITLPTESWAEMFYDIYEEQMWEFEQQFGRRPDLRLNGRIVTLDALIIGDVTKSQIDSMIFVLDWANNCPFLFRIFEE